MINPYIQLAKDNMSNPQNIENWKFEFEMIKNNLSAAQYKHLYKNVYGNWQDFCPYIQYIKLDALDKKDWANGIAENSIYVSFKIDFVERTVEIFRTGHVWISDADKELYPRDKYLAMHSMKEITKRNQGKVMRKCRFKSVHELVEKILKGFDNIMTEVVNYTGEYPYKKGINALKTA